MATIQYLTTIHIDFGVLALLPAECERHGMRKPLLVTDAGVRDAGVLAQAQAAGDTAGDLLAAILSTLPLP